jgi:intracellular multiplication protein IcmV
MGVKKIIKKGFFSALNPVNLIGVESLKNQTARMSAIFKGTVKDVKEGDGYKPTSFEDCMRHYDVTEEDLKKKMRNSLYITYFCLSLSLITFVYMFFQISKASLMGGLMCLILTVLLWAMSIREHFNLYQMRQRRLGCSFKEWFCSLFKK